MNIQEYFDAKEPALNGLYVKKTGNNYLSTIDSPSASDPYAPWHYATYYVDNNTFSLSKKSSVTLTYEYTHEEYDDRGGTKWEKEKDKVYRATISIYTKQGPVTIKIKDDPNLNVEDFIRSCAYLEKIGKIYGKEALKLGPEPTASDVMKIIDKYPLTDSEKAQTARAMEKTNKLLFAKYEKAELKYNKKVLNLTKQEKKLQQELRNVQKDLIYSDHPGVRKYRENYMEIE